MEIENSHYRMWKLKTRRDPTQKTITGWWWQNVPLEQQTKRGEEMGYTQGS